MHGQVDLTSITIVVVAALLGGLGLARLKQPPILGYILTGVILGPSGAGLIQAREQVSVLAELGVLMLLFVIGMELSLRTFKKVWVVSTLTVVMQIVISLCVAYGLSYFFAWPSGISLLLAFVLSLSSTAVVFKMLETIGEIKSDTGQLAIGVLIAEDLAIVPMILILHNVDRPWFDPELLIKIFLSIGLIVALIMYLSRRQRVRVPLAAMIAGEKDLIPLASLTLCFGAAAISGLMGLSAAYGAFLAGLILGNTNERLVMLETAKPIQSLLLMTFFLSIGLLLDISFIWEHFSVMLLLLFMITIGKTAMNIGILRVLRLPWSQAFLLGVLLAQVGEFAFLLTTVSHDTNTISDYGENLIISLTVLSLSFSPIWLALARRLKAITDARQISLKVVLHQAYGNEVNRFKRFAQQVRDQFNRPETPPTMKDTPDILDEDD